MEQYDLTTLISAINGTAHGVTALDSKFQQVQIDTRELNSGDVFWAIPGEQQDGHRFVDEAFRQGATAAIIDKNHAPSTNRPCIAVDNTIDALAAWAKWHRQQLDTLAIGITGSVGKTTTRELLFSVLSQKFKGTRSPKNYNNHLGVPLSLLGAESKHEFIVLEMGASHPGEIKQLSNIAEPEIGIVTAIGPAHVEGFGSLENIIRSKGELIESLPSSGIAILAGDDPRVRQMAQLTTGQVILVGTQEHNNIRATDVRVENRKLTFVVDGESYQLNVTGKHFLTSALCSIAVARELGLTTMEINSGLKEFRSLQGRGDFVRVGSWMIINDSYNANPTSMSAACELLQSWNTDGQRIFVCGDMLELGIDAADYHFETGKQIGRAGFDGLIALGDFARDMTRGALKSGMSSYQVAECDNKQTLLTILHCWLEPGAVLLLKGSRSMKMETIIESLRELNDAHFNEHLSQLLSAAA